MDLHAWDLGILFRIGAMHRPWLDNVMKIVTHLGDAKTMVLATLLALLLFSMRRRFVAAAAVIGAVVLGLAISETIKPIVHRPRPDVTWRLIDLPDEMSFPSGHSLCSMAFYGGLGLVLSRRVSSMSLRIVLPVAGIGLSLLIGFSRCYLGVHYPLDVFSGWIAGLACALLAFWVDGKWGAPGVSRPLLTDGSRPEVPRSEMIRRAP